MHFFLSINAEAGAKAILLDDFYLVMIEFLLPQGLFVSESSARSHSVISIQGLLQEPSETNGFLLLKFETSRAFWGLTRWGPFDKICLGDFLRTKQFKEQ